jgi:BMFP domain-containing protein YqiC
MTMFSDLGKRNLYLCDQLITTRKYNEVLEARVIELMADLRDSNAQIDALVAHLT